MELEKIAMVHTLSSKLFRVRGHEALVDEIVQHGIDVSFATQALASRLNAPSTQAFLAGLFHDVGKLVLLQTIARVQQKLGKAP